MLHHIGLLFTSILTITWTATLITMASNGMECDFVCKWDCAHCYLMEEYCNEDGINWEKVCHILQEVPSLCSIMDDWDWYPLHFACYHNAPQFIIETLVNIWPEGLNEMVKVINMQHDMTALELACDSDAMDDVIIYLYKSAHNHCLPVTDWRGSLLMERNQNVHLIKGYFANDDSWNLNEYLYCPQKDDQWIK